MRKTLAIEVVDDYQGILRNQRPVIDVRAPEEYGKGSIPSAVNLPILNNDERRQVGVCYKNYGQRKAVELGQKLVTASIRSKRVSDWASFVDSHEDALFCCWRGGLRSRTAYQWLAEAGSIIPIVKGGSKALRGYCLQRIEESTDYRWLVLGGRTGSGKTRALQQLSNTIDLERLAAHRGSAFGGNIALQPSPISFENALAADLLSIVRDRPVVVEDESRTIGRLALPESLFRSIQNAPLVILELSLEERIANIYDEYVVPGVPASFINALWRIRRRLGGTRYRELLDLMKSGFDNGNQESHLRWIKLLLTGYYDPMYDYQLGRKHERIVYRGSMNAVSEYLRERIVTA